MIWGWKTSSIFFLNFLFSFVYAGQEVEEEFSIMPEFFFFIFSP